MKFSVVNTGYELIFTLLLMSLVWSVKIYYEAVSSLAENH
jgi:hypothetical protein